MKLRAFALRNFKELIRDPLSLVFGIGLPVVLLLLISVINQSTGMAVSIFEIGAFAPGMALFSLSFVAMFSGMLLARDRTSSFLPRLFASPLTAADFILGYCLPLLPIGILQVIACFGTALFLGLPFTVQLLATVALFIPVSFLFIGMGLLFGALFSDRQFSGVMTIMIQVIALSSGMWFDLEMIGGAIKAVCSALPFYHALKSVQAALAGQLASALPNLAVCMAYAAAFCVAATLVFRRKMKG